MEKASPKDTTGPEVECFNQIDNPMNQARQQASHQISVAEDGI